MQNRMRIAFLTLLGGLSLWSTGCSNRSVGIGISSPAVQYTLTVDSINPASGVAITVSPSDNNSLSSGSTVFTRTYNSGSTVTLTAPATASGNTFSSWSGCTSVSSTVCTVTLTANTAVTATYTTPPPTTYLLTVNSTNPASGVAITVSPSDNSSC